MTTQQITFLLPPYGSASLALPEMLTPETFARLDAAISDALREPHRCGTAEAADDPGAVEFDSWTVHRR
ncbi:MAG: hypothetical protein ABI696_03060 [Rubrivivax sp.]